MAAGRTLGQRTSCPLLWRRIHGLRNGRDVRCPSRAAFNGRDVRCPSAAVTKADLRAAVKTILRGEDVNAAKPGPRLTPAKRRQIEAAENYRATHCGCTLHNACLRSFVRVKGGYKSGKALYRVMLRTAKDDT